MTWRRRALRSAPPEGYIAVVSLEPGDEGPAEAALTCEAEGVELRLEGDRWRLTGPDGAEAKGVVRGTARRGFFVKRTARRLLLGANGEWVHGLAAGPLAAPPAIRVGLGGGWRLGSMRIMPREPVRFATDFPDPEPRTQLWQPVRGRWVLRSLSSPEQSANPAELAVVFDSMEDVASAGRTRAADIGIGVQLQGGSTVRVARVAPGSPAARAGLREGDRIEAVDGSSVATPAEAAALLEGAVGTSAVLTVLSDGGRRQVELEREVVVWGQTHRHVPIPPCEEDGEALIVTGYDFWTDYRFTAAVQTRGVGAFGLVFAWLGPEDYHVFRWLGAQDVRRGYGRMQVERVRDGVRHVVAARDGGFLAQDFYRLSVAIEGDRLGEVRAVCHVDGRQVLEAYDDAIVPGKLGFWAGEPGAACFDDVVVGQHQEGEGEGSRSSVQRRDRVMRAWADPSFSWQYVGEQETWWHKENFFGDVTLRAPATVSKSLRLVVGASSRDPASGYCLEAADEGKTLRLVRAGSVLKEEALAQPPPESIALQRQGSRIRLLLDDKVCLEHQDEAPLTGSNVGAGGGNIRDASVSSPNAVTDYFNGCPVDWHVMHGDWEVMNRWVCDPRWSFFGGRSEGVLAAWSKRPLEGECALSVHVGVLMMARNPRYDNWRDIGLTLCGDGKNLDSGYAAIVGAGGNQVTVLCRNGKVVKATEWPAALLPTRRGGGGELYSQHRGWVHIKLVKEGDTVRLFVWDREVLSYRDPHPLEGGRAAIWSVNNGILLAKARLAASALGEPRPALRHYRPYADAVLTNDCEGAKTRIERTGSIHAITNTVGGGTFAAALRPRVFSAYDRPRLSFEVKLQPDVKVDLYLTCRGQLYRVILSGPADGPCPAEMLGTFEGVRADGQWHRASFDLLGALRRRHPDDGLLMVWEPRFANYNNLHYLVAGFEGNHAGATYWLRDLALPFEARSGRLSAALSASRSP
ncbi:MAG: PDZ domain-containing protein [Candidatus Brocadiia bacterium]